MTPRKPWLVSGAFLLVLAAPRLGAVVINEIHYHPPVTDGKSLEFIELLNPGTTAVSIAGWRLQGGIDFTFPPGSSIEPGGFVIVCKDCDDLRTRVSGDTRNWLGSYDGSLENAGETIELVDSLNAHVDAVVYDDELPWPTEADGDGQSLQRLCPDTFSSDPLNWVPGLPTPAAMNVDSACPPPPFFTPPIVITEILYHPGPAGVIHSALEDGEDDEFLELHNPGTTAVNLRGWSFEEGISFTFPDVAVPPGGFLLVARNAAKAREKYGITNVVGDFEGKLSNSGERIALVDDRDNYVDAVTYADSGEWPYAPDGFGRSLERVVATGPASDPANWKASALLPSPSYQRLVSDGPLGQGLTQKIILAIDGEGEILIDNVKLEALDMLGVNLLVNGDFEAGLEGWVATGTMADSVLVPGGGVGGSQALRLLSRGVCPNGECGAANSVSNSLPPGLRRATNYRVTVEFKYVRGSPQLRAGLFLGAGVRIRDLSTAGRANTAAATELPPFITNVNRFPLEPRSTDEVTITARVRSIGAVQVSLTHQARGNEATITMLDDGRHGDGLAGDGVFGAELPPFPHDTQVTFRIRATAGGKVAEYPVPLDQGTWRRFELAGYYVNDLQSDSPLPIYHILLDGLASTDPDTLESFLNCFTLTTGSFAAGGDLYPDVGVRFRGHTACAPGFRKKNLKVVFNRGRYFGGLQKINLQGMWTDKALVREHLSWDFVRQLGVPYFDTHYVRVHMNGLYHGLFLYLEHHGGDFLERNGLEPGGNLYLAKQPPREERTPIGVRNFESEAGYMGAWEKETNEDSDYSDIREFVDLMHNGGGLTVPFWRDRTFEEMTIGYQVTHVVLDNIDSFAKNHFLYHDVEQDRWGHITWDLDLTFGKFFTVSAVFLPDRPVGTLNDIMLCGRPFDPSLPDDLNPWFGATMLGNPLLHHLVNFFFLSGAGNYQRAYLVRLWNVLEEKYRNDVYDPRLDELRDFLASEQAEDIARWGRYPTNVPGFPEDMASNIQVIKSQIACHRDSLRRFIQDFHSTIPAQPRVKITEVMYWPENGEDDLEFLEILNTSGREIDISGWSTEGVTFRFNPGTVIPAGATFILARSPARFRARYGERGLVFGPYNGRLANEGEEIRILDAGPGHPATIDYLRYEMDPGWPQVLPGHSLELTGVSPTRDNDDPRNWVASRVTGGTPGRATSSFIRGEVNEDAMVNLTDGIAILEHLFRGGAAPPCPDAADTNDDGKVDLTDPIFLLQHLFQSGTAPPPPYPDSGNDPTADAMAC
jgi:hypothetical protein